MAALGPKSSTQHDGTVSIEVNPDGPYGIVTAAGPNGRCAVIKEWSRMPDGKFGALQIHGGIRLGDFIVRVNDIDCTGLTFAQAGWA